MPRLYHSIVFFFFPQETRSLLVARSSSISGLAFINLIIKQQVDCIEEVMLNYMAAKVKRLR